MLTGRWRDAVTGPAGETLARAPWRANLIVDGAYSLVAGLLARDRSLEGILFWAVGEGEEGWDEERPATTPDATRLTSEILRQEVAREAIRHVETDGSEAEGPTAELEVRLTFEWEAPVTLREFGIFGGDAEGRANSGVMINHVIHPRIDLGEGQRLTRELRLSLGRGVDRRWDDLPRHPLGEEPVRVVDGVGREFGRALADVGLPTVDALARSDPEARVDVPRVRMVEFRSKARLALRTLQELQPPARLFRLTVSDVLRTPAEDLAERTGARVAEVARLREQLATLELTLDHAFLGRMRVGRLVGPSAGGGGPQR